MLIEAIYNGHRLLLLLLPVLLLLWLLQLLASTMGAERDGSRPPLPPPFLARHCSTGAGVGDPRRRHE